MQKINLQIELLDSEIKKLNEISDNRHNSFVAGLIKAAIKTPPALWQEAHRETLWQKITNPFDKNKR